MRSLGADDHVVVVGAGLAGWRLSEGLRREGFTGAITLIGDEHHTPYDRPPLSKQVLSGKWELDKTELATMDRLRELDIDARFGAPAVGLDVDAARVTLGDGSTVHGTFVVVATGVRARRLPFSAASELHAVRTREDVERLRSVLAEVPTGSTVAVIGGGFIGAEAATSLLGLGYVPVVLEAAPRPLDAVLGSTVASWLEPLAHNAGIDLLVNQQITDVHRSEGGFRVERANGDALQVSAVILGVGAVPNTEWLSDSGLSLHNGVVVDEYLLAGDTVGAIGDVARFTWRHDPFVEQVRIEHWQTANDHAAALAATLTRGSQNTSPLAMVPYFWSDQYGKKIQMLGHPSASDDVTLVHGSLEEGKWLALYARDGVVTGLVALNQPRALMVSRGLLEPHATWVDALAAAPWSQ